MGEGHGLLCNYADGDPAALLSEMLSIESESALFLPLAVHITAAVVAQAATGSAAHGERVLSSARELFGSLASGGPWVEIAGSATVPGHFPEEEEEESASCDDDDEEDEQGEEEEESASEAGASEEDGGGSGDGEGDKAHVGEDGTGLGVDDDPGMAEVRVLLPASWQLLVGTLRQRMPPSPTTRRVMSTLESYGPGWLGQLVGALERNALPASASMGATSSDGNSSGEAGGLEGMVFVASASMLNHSCHPNCAVYYGPSNVAGGASCPMAPWDGWSHVALIALRNIDAEEELTISYLDGELPWRRRRSALRMMHGFTCRCEKCEVQRGASKLGVNGGEASLNGLATLGLRALDAGLYTESIDIHRRLLSQRPNSGGCPAYTRQRRADALLRLGGALVRLHKFDEARRTWLRASNEHPEHDELRKEAEVARAYLLDADGSAASSTRGTGKRPRMSICHAEVYVSTVPRELDAVAPIVHLSVQPVIAPEDCARIVALCEGHAAATGGWATQRHTSVPTTDMEVRAVPEVCALFRHACATALFPLLASTYGTSHGATVDNLRVWDAFVVRYDARAQRSLPTHADDSHLSLTIALNGRGEYVGGGTSFEAPLQRMVAADGKRGTATADEVLCLVRPEVGCAVAFPGELRHGGAPVTEGVRYIIAAFLWVSQD